VLPHKSLLVNIYKTLTSVPSRGREGAWQKIKNVKKGGGLDAPERASLYITVMSVPSHKHEGCVARKM